MSIIQNKDIYDASQGNPFESIEKFIDLLDKKIELAKKTMQGLETTIKDVNKTSTGKEAQTLITNTEKLSKETEKLTALEKARLGIETQIVKANAQLALTYENQDTKLKQVKLENQLLNKSKQQSIKLNSDLVGAYEKESIQLNKLRTDYKNLAAAGKENTIEGRKLLQQVSQLDTKLKAIDSSVGQYQRNVGNYGSALKNLGLQIKNFLIGGGIVIAFQKLIQFGKDATNEAEQAQKAYGKVEQAVLTTGNAAGYTADELARMASELEANSIVDADKIMNDVTAQLLTFTKVGGEEFKRAQQAALDLSTVLGTDLKGVSIQLGKALQDPVRGLTALRRSGISFTEDQQNVIKALVKTGQVAEAQRVILTELEKQYGGQAKKASEIGLGPLQQLEIKWNNFKELIGNGLIVILNKFAQVAGDALTKFINYTKDSIHWVVNFINGWIELYNESLLFRAIIEAIGTTFTITWKTIKLFFELMKDGISNVGEQLGYAFNPKNWGAGFTKGLQDIISKNRNDTLKDIKDYGKEIGDTFVNGIKNTAKGKVKLIDFTSNEPESVKSQVNDINTGNTTNNSKDLEKEKEESDKARAYELKKNKEFLDQREKDGQDAIDNEQKILDEESQRIIDNDQSVWDYKLGDYERQKQLSDKKLEEEKERQSQLQQTITDTAIATGQVIGDLLAKGELSFKEFSKVILTTALDVLQKQLLIIGVEILGREIAKKSFFGIASSAILIGTITAAFAGIKSKVQSFAGGTDYVNGPGTETSDSINARLSKGERVVPAHINKQLQGISNKDLPKIIQAGMNSEKMENLLNEVKFYTAISAGYLSHGRNDWTDGNFKYYQNWKTGEIVRRHE